MTWPVVPLGDVADTALGKMLDRGRRRGLPEVPYLRNINVQWGRVDTSDLLAMELADEERERFAVRPGDLLVCEGGEIGRCAIWRGREGYLAYQKALHRVRPGRFLDAAYLRYVLEHHARSGVLERLSTGSTIAHLPQQALRQVPVPLPSIGEQCRIVDILEDHLSRLDAAKSYLETADSRQRTLHDHVFTSALQGIEFEDAPLDEVLEAGLANGRSVPTKAGGFPVLRLTALADGRVNLSERKEGAWSFEDAQRYLVRRGDFLIARGNGSLRLVGRGGLVVDDPSPVAFPDTLIRARPNPERILPEYLAIAWNGAAVRRQIERSAKTTAGIYKVNQRDLAAVRLPVPSLEAQGWVIRSVAETRSGLSNLAGEIHRAKTRSELLRRSLLADALSGRLTSRNLEASTVQGTIGI